MTISDANIDRLLRVVLLSMSRHAKYELYLISSSNPLYTIMGYIHSINHIINEELKEEVISCLIDSMMAHKNDYQVSQAQSNSIESC